MSSFDDFMTLGAPAQASWSSIETALTKEGAPDVDIQRAKLVLGDQAMGLLGMVQNDTMQAISSATDYVKVGDTLAGSVANVGAMISAAKSGNAPQLVQVTTGLLIGVATAAGAVSAGVGAAVVGAVAALSSILASHNLYQYSVVGCPGWGYKDKPGYMIGCMYITTNPGPRAVAPLIQTAKGPVTNPLWLRMQDFLKTDTVFNTNVQTYLNRYKGIQIPDDIVKRNPAMYDLFFPGWTPLMQGKIVSGTLPGTMNDFLASYKSAWLSNKEAILNGHVGNQDYEVLAYAVRAWNRCHDLSGPSYVLGSTATTLPVGTAIQEAKTLQPSDIAGASQLYVYTSPRKAKPLPVSVSVPVRTISLKLAPAPVKKISLKLPPSTPVSPPHLTALDAISGTAPKLAALSSAPKSKTWEYLLGAALLGGVAIAARKVS